MNKISVETPVEDIVQDHTWAVVMLARKGIVCIQCGEPVWGTLGEAAARAGIADVPGLIDELNQSQPEQN